MSAPRRRYRVFIPGSANIIRPEDVPSIRNGDWSLGREGCSECDSRWVEVVRYGKYGWKQVGKKRFRSDAEALAWIKSRKVTR